MIVEEKSFASINQESQSEKREKVTGVNVAGYFQAESGLGEGVRSTVRSLEAANVPFVLNNCNFNLEYHNSDTSYKNFSHDNPYPVNIVQINADAIVKFVNSFGREYLKNRYNIGFWLWEMLRFPREWFYAFNLFDEIWTPSDFCVEAIAAVSPVPVVKIPLSINLPAASMSREAVGLPADKFVFLFIFDFCSSADRKNPFALIKAFIKAFGRENKDVTLVIKSSNAEILPEKAAQMHAEANGAKNIKFINKSLGREAINSLIAHCDCYVSLHRAEGFGLTPAEAMFHGKPVIATNYSANTDFMNVNNSFPVKFKLSAVGQDFGFFKKDDLWADADVDHAAEIMRFVYENRAEAKLVGERAASDIREFLSPQLVGRRIKDRLEIISDYKDNFAESSQNKIAEARSETARARIEFAESESRQLRERIREMENSRFWKIRSQWVRLKRFTGISHDR
ncbi:MAG TPA: glycosyltransferase family 4 protein [Pyrinomonadaceae bacterium]|jgi:glycosyltransferase involved in cell wall biosynthesis